MRALADAQMGRVRDAEKTLHELAATSDEAALHLALLLLATRRIQDGLKHLLTLRTKGGPEADAARFQLLIHGEGESIPEPESLLEEITDPWIRREALSLLDARR